MNCDEARGLLELSFGSDDLPDELVSHLQECRSCDAYRRELTRLGEQLGSDNDFVLPQADLDCAVRSVEEEIAASRTIRLLPVNWLRPMIRVAAAVLIVAVSFSVYQLGKYSQTTEAGGVDPSAGYTYGDVVSLWQGDLEEEMDEGLISILIDDYISDGYFEAGEALLGDISEEEMEYLVENFEVGELL